MLKRFVVLAVMAMVGFASSGCGLMSSPARAVPAEYVELPSVTPAAAALVGQSEAEQAAHEMTAFTLATAFNPALLDPAQQSYTSDELNSALIQEALAPGALPLWNALVDEASAGNRDAQEEVKGLQMFALDQPTWQVNPDGKIVHSQSITDVVVDVLGATETEPADDVPATEGTEVSELAESEGAEAAATPKLKVTFTHVARLRYIEDKYPFEVVFTRQMQFNLVPSGSDAGQRTPTKITVVTATPSVPARPGNTASGTAKPSSAKPTTVKPTTAKPTTAKPTTAKPTTAKPTTAKPTTAKPTTAKPTTTKPTTTAPTTTAPTTTAPTQEPTTEPPADPPKPTAADPLPIAIAALIVPMEVPSGAETPSDPSSADPSSTAIGGRLWQISAFFGPFTVDTVALPR